MKIDTWLIDARAGAARPRTARTRAASTLDRIAVLSLGRSRGWGVGCTDRRGDLDQARRLPRALRGQPQMQAVRLPGQLDRGAQRRLGLQQLGLAPVTP